MPPYTPDELIEVIADLHKLHEEATPVPWDNDKGVVRGPEGGPPFIRGFPPVSWQGVNGYQPKRTLDNVKLAVKARNALPRLLATLEAQAAEIESLENKHGNQCTRAAYYENEAERAMAQLTRWRAEVTEIRDTARRGGSVRSFIRANLCDEILKIMGEEA